MFHHAAQGAVDVVGCDGPIDVSSAEQFAAFARERIATGQPRIVVDLGDVPFIDGRGLETLLQLQDECIPRGGQLQAAAPSPLVREILHITEVSEVVELFDDVPQAVASFAR